MIDDIHIQRCQVIFLPPVKVMQLANKLVYSMVTISKI